MSKAMELVRKAAQEIVDNEDDCYALVILGDCGKCPYLEYDNEICDGRMRQEMKELLSGMALTEND